MVFDIVFHVVIYLAPRKFAVLVRIIAGPDTLEFERVTDVNRPLAGSDVQTGVPTFTQIIHTVIRDKN